LQISLVDAVGGVTTYAYDKNSRLTTTTDPLSHITQTSYDGNGNAVTKTDAKGYVTTYVYDAFNRLTQVKDPDGNVLFTYAYDKNDNMLTQTDRANTVTTMAYNVRNLMTTRTVTGGTAEKWTYRADGLVATGTDRKGQVTTYTYDIHGRLLNKVIGTSTISYTYDNDGNELSMYNGVEKTERTYDILNRVLTKKITIGTASYTSTFAYDVTTGQTAGWYAETSTDAKSNVTTKVYDKTKRLYSVTSGGKTTAYAYYANGATKTVTYSGGATEEYAYYADGRLNTLSNKKSATVIIEAYNYAYDANGNMTSKLDGKGTTSYTYDKMNRLLTVTEPSGKKTTYTYDTAGNRSTETSVSGATTITKTYTYNTLGWLTSTSEVNGTTTTKVTYAYDGNGNQISRMNEVTSPASGTSSGDLSNASDYAAYYVYDVWNNMAQSVSKGTTVDNYYDGDGLRYGKKVNGGDMTVSFYEYSDVTLEINGTTGAQTAVNVYGNQLISRNGQYYMFNGHGDVTAILDASSNVVASYYYDAFGVHTSITGSVSNPFRYAGYKFDDETGLYYLNSRYYDPATARFLSEDTYRGQSSDPLSLNLYSYVKYNPLTYVDPMGHANVYVNDVKIGNGTPSSSGSSMGNERDIVTAAGGTVGWDDPTRTATFGLNGHTMTTVLGRDDVTVTSDGHILSTVEGVANWGDMDYTKITKANGDVYYYLTPKQKETNKPTPAPSGGGNTGGGTPSGNNGTGGGTDGNGGGGGNPPITPTSGYRPASLITPEDDSQALYDNWTNFSAKTNADCTAPLTVSMYQNVIKIRVNINFVGDADSFFVNPDGNVSTETYAQLIVKAIIRMWSNNLYNEYQDTYPASDYDKFGNDNMGYYDGVKVQVIVHYTINSTDNANSMNIYFNSHKVSDSANFPTWEANMVANSYPNTLIQQHVPNVTPVSTGWSKTNPGTMYLFATREDSTNPDKTPYTQEQFMNTAAHEFGHLLGLADIYSDPYWGILDNATDEVPPDDIMRIIDKGAKVTPNDIEMVINAWKTNTWQVYDTSPVVRSR